jgi:hypothetical protein
MTDFNPDNALTAASGKQNGEAAEPAPGLEVEHVELFCTKITLPSLGQEESKPQTPTLETAAHSESFLQPRHWLLSQIGLVGSVVQSVLATHATHLPALVPVAAHTGVAPEQGDDPPSWPAPWPAFWHPVQALLTQNPLVGSLLQPLLSMHSTHWPAAAPAAAHTGLLPVHAVAPAAPQPAHWLATQNAFVASAVQSVAARQPTHFAFAVSQTGAAPAQCLLATQATQRPLVASQAGAPARPAQSLSTAHLAQTKFRQSGSALVHS